MSTVHTVHDGCYTQSSVLVIVVSTFLQLVSGYIGTGDRTGDMSFAEPYTTCVKLFIYMYAKPGHGVAIFC